MSTPIKRLEIIKNAIELEDDDIIQSQLTRLKNEAFDDELQAVSYTHLTLPTILRV